MIRSKSRHLRSSVSRIHSFPFVLSIEKWEILTDTDTPVCHIPFSFIIVINYITHRLTHFLPRKLFSIPVYVTHFSPSIFICKNALISLHICCSLSPSSQKFRSLPFFALDLILFLFCTYLRNGRCRVLPLKPRVSKIVLVYFLHSHVASRFLSCSYCTRTLKKNKFLFLPPTLHFVLFLDCRSYLFSEKKLYFIELPCSL